MEKSTSFSHLTLEERRFILKGITDGWSKAAMLNKSVRINQLLSHVNSAPVEKRGGKSPLELAEFIYPDLYKKLVISGIRKIEKDKILLRPYLLQ